MDESKWRVRKILVEAPVSSPIIAPYQIQGLQPLKTAKMAVWGVWAPNWPLSGSPLLFYGTLPKAHEAATRRADFAQAPAPPTLPDGWKIWDYTRRHDVET